MPLFRNTIRRSSRRERMRHIDRAFEILCNTFLVCYFLFVVSSWLSYRPSWRIGEVRVEGAQAVDVALVKGAVESELARHFLWKINRNNIILFPRWATRTAIMALDTRIKNVIIAVERKRITVHISEYSPAFLWCSPESFSTTTMTMTGCSFADDTGHIFAPAPAYSGNPFMVFATTRSEENHGAVLSKEEFGKVNLFLQKLADLKFTPRVVRESVDHDYTIETDEPWVIRWSSERDSGEDARNLSLVLQNLSSDHVSTSTLKSVDLRFGNKVFYR